MKTIQPRKEFFVVIIVSALLLWVSFVPTRVFASHSCTGNIVKDQDSTLSQGHPCVERSGYDKEVAGTGNRGEYVNPGGSPKSYDSSEDGDKITTFGGLLNAINRLLNASVPFLIGLAVFVVIYGIFGYISHSGDEEKRAEARQFIIWGVIFIFAMISIWGLINLLSNTFLLDKVAPSVDSIFPTRN